MAELTSRARLKQEAMYVHCAECPLRQSAAFRTMTDEELRFIAGMKFDQRRVPARTDILAAGDTVRSIYTIFSGWAFRYMTLKPDRRQILDLALPGDLLGLQAPMTGRVMHSAQSITDVQICFLEPGRFHQIFTDLPGLAEALMATLLMEEQRSDARILMLGQQRPTQRLGYLLLETRERLLRRGWQAQQSFEFPLTYRHLADALGLSRSQVASSLRELRQRGWASVGNGEAVIYDDASMAIACQYPGLPEAQLRALV